MTVAALAAAAPAGVARATAPQAGRSRRAVQAAAAPRCAGSGWQCNQPAASRAGGPWPCLRLRAARPSVPPPLPPPPQEPVQPVDAPVAAQRGLPQPAVARERDLRRAGAPAPLAAGGGALPAGHLAAVPAGAPGRPDWAPQQAAPPRPAAAALGSRSQAKGSPALQPLALLAPCRVMAAWLHAPGQCCGGLISTQAPARPAMHAWRCLLAAG